MKAYISRATFTIEATPKHQGVHILNTPADVPTLPILRRSTTGLDNPRALTAEGMMLTTHTTDRSHPWNGETKKAGLGETV